MKNHLVLGAQSLSRILAILLVALIGLGSVACTGKHSTSRDFPMGKTGSLVDRSLDTGEPCALPCWYRLTPGVSTDNEAIQILKDRTFIDSASIQKQGNEIRWRSSLTDWGGGSIRIDSDGRVEFITFALEYSLTLQALIEMRGKPDGFFALYDEPSGKVSIELLWTQSGLSASAISGVSPSEFTKVSPLNPDMLILSVNYFEPVFDAKEYASKLGTDWWIKDGHYYPWTGYDPLPTRGQ